MTYTGACPHCGAIVRGGHGSPMKRIDTPIRVCHQCGKPYIDGNMYEWAVISVPYKIWYYFFANNRIWILLLIFLLAFNYPFLWIILPALWIFGCIAWVHLASKNKIEESKKRCSDPRYVDRLCASGYDKIRSDIYNAFQKRQAGTTMSRGSAHQEHPAQPPVTANSKPKQSSCRPNYRAPFWIAAFSAILLAVVLLAFGLHNYYLNTTIDELEEKVNELSDKYVEAYDAGYAAGYNSGYSSGSDNSYIDGYFRGYNEAAEQSEEVDALDTYTEKYLKIRELQEELNGNG